MGQYLYSAKDGTGRETRGFVEATGASEALQQLKAQGLRDITLHTDELMSAFEQDALPGLQGMLDPGALIDGQQDGGFSGLWRGLFKGVLPILIPLLLWNAWSLSGDALAWYDWLGLVLTGLYLLFTFWVALPGVLFESLLRAQLWGRWEDALRWVGYLRRIGRLSPLVPAPHVLDFYTAKSLIGLGRKDEGLNLFRRHLDEGVLPQEPLLSLLADLLDEARLREEAGNTMRRVTELMPDSAQGWLDLALNRALHGGIEEAEQALGRASCCPMTPLLSAVTPYVQGELASRTGECAKAAERYAQALRQLEPFASQTAAQPLLVRVVASHAISLAQCGQIEDARRAWERVAPLIKAQRDERLLEAWQAVMSRSV
ncbi:MAG: hypothetical protein PHI49_04345 [Halothiobacillaceae bacterium]|nr:hypothetical protein [Halothiobacillaceae bacterium]